MSEGRKRGRNKNKKKNVYLNDAEQWTQNEGTDREGRRRERRIGNIGSEGKVEKNRRKYKKGRISTRCGKKKKNNTVKTDA